MVAAFGTRFAEERALILTVFERIMISMRCSRIGDKGLFTHASPKRYLAGLGSARTVKAHALIMAVFAFPRYGMLVAALAPSAASALSPNLARLCRDAALKSYPYQLPGTGPGNAQNEIRAYKDCIAKGGKIEPPGSASPPNAIAPSNVPSH